MKSRFEAHTLAMGKLAVSLHSFECLLRVYLFYVDLQAGNAQAPQSSPFDVKRKGDTVDESMLTNYDSLRALIRKYNAVVPAGRAKLDESIVAIRDALAHGRVLGEDAEFATVCLYKFSRPSNGRVLVEFAEQIDEAWLSSTLRQINAQLELVRREFEKNFPGMIG